MMSAFQSTKKSVHKKWCIVRLCNNAEAEVHSLHRFQETGNLGDNSKSFKVVSQKNDSILATVSCKIS